VSLELRGISKSFGALLANDSIDLRVETGEIHAILGENGAGKSTLMNIVYGLVAPDSGEILVDDVVKNIKEPSDALASGIGMVHQHFMLVPVFTVAENIVLGHEKSGFAGKLDLNEARERIKKVSDQFNFDVNPDDLIEGLPVGVQQRVEIIRALIYDAKVLILDEPTAVLTPQETDDLLKIMKQLKEQGTSIIFITHKLREVKAVADRITIIRRGKVVGNETTSTTGQLFYQRWPLQHAILEMQGINWTGDTTFDHESTSFDGGATFWGEWTEPRDTLFDQNQTVFNQDNTVFNNPYALWQDYAYYAWGTTQFDSEFTIFDLYATIFDTGATPTASITQLRRLLRITTQQISGHDVVV